MAKKKKHVCPAGLPAWLVTYGDMMSLLLTFFILLFSFSSVNASKFSKVVVSLQGALGVLSGGEQLLIDGSSPHSRDSKGEHTYMELQGAAFRLEEELKNMNMESEAAVVLDKRGLVVMIASSLLFEPASVDIRDAAKPLLIRLAELIASFPNLIRVEGHAAQIATRTERFPSNWELAAGRASSVVRYFIEREPLIAQRLSVVSYSDLHPVAPNDIEENRAKNRRVEIVFERFREEEEG